MAIPVDVADFDSCKECVARIAKEVGPVDILVNNAGITRDTTFKKMSKGDWDSVIRTNLDSVFNMTKQVMDGMVDRGWGRVVNVSSVAGSCTPCVRSLIHSPLAWMNSPAEIVAA